MKRETIAYILVGIIIFLFLYSSQILFHNGESCAECKEIDTIDVEGFERSWIGSGLYATEVSYNYNGDKGWYISWAKDPDEDVPFGLQCGSQWKPEYDSTRCQIADLTRERPNEIDRDWLVHAIGSYYSSKGVRTEVFMILECATCEVER